MRVTLLELAFKPFRILATFKYLSDVVFFFEPEMNKELFKHNLRKY